MQQLLEILMKSDLYYVGVTAGVVEVLLDLLALLLDRLLKFLNGRMNSQKRINTAMLSWLLNNGSGTTTASCVETSLPCFKGWRRLLVLTSRILCQDITKNCRPSFCNHRYCKNILSSTVRYPSLHRMPDHFSLDY